jgi:uncharacterized membrane protein YfcA
MVPIIALLLGPLEAIAITAIAMILGNLLLLPSAIKIFHWPEVAPVSIALAIAIPLGLTFLVSADPVLIRRGMGVFILVGALVLMTGWTFR